MQIVLPCKNSLLRSQTTQKPSKKTGQNEFLDPCLEEEIAKHLVSEVNLLLKLEQQKKDMCNLPGFNIKNLFLAITDQPFFNETILRRFLKKIGHQPTKLELTNIMRRFDLNGNN